MSAGLDVESTTDAATAEEFEQAQEASVIKLVNDLIIEAVADRATDVHIEPYEKELVIRYRVDGVLQRANVPPTINRFANAIISRLKIMANLNIAEKRKPQDGRITFRYRNPDRGYEEYDLRVGFRLTLLEIGFTRVSGSGTDVALVTITRQGKHQDDTHTLASVAEAGVGCDVALRVSDDKKKSYEVSAGRKLKVAWTTPDGENIAWAMRRETEPL